MRIKRLTAIMGAYWICQNILGYPLFAQEKMALPDSSLIPVNTELSSTDLPEKWTLEDCINYALKENISLQKSRINASSSDVDVLTAKAALFPSLSFSTSQNLVNRPYQESGNTVNGTEILRNNGKTSYNGNYGLNAQWTVYNGNKRTKTIEQEKLNNQIAKLDISTTANSIEESITQIYVQILYASESVKVNENTLAVSKAQCERGKQLLEAGSLSKADYAQLEAQVSSDNYQLVTSQAALEDYKLQLKQLLELGGEEEMDLYLPVLEDAAIVVTLPSKSEVYQTALATRPEIESGQLNVAASALNIDIAKAGYIPTISMSAGIGTNNTSGSDFTFAQQVKNGWNNSIGLSVNVPIFSNRQTKSAVQKAKLQYESSQLDLMEKHKELYKTIEGLWLDANSAQQQYIAAQEKLRSTSTSFELVNEQFNQGMKNTVELLTEKNNLLSAQQEVLQAKYMAILNMQLLNFYQGKEINIE